MHTYCWNVDELLLSAASIQNPAPLKFTMKNHGPGRSGEDPIGYFRGFRRWRWNRAVASGRLDNTQAQTTLLRIVAVERPLAPY